MPSLTHTYLESQPISPTFLTTIRRLGEYKGKHDLFTKQTPQVLEALQESAKIQSIEASNRIEGVVASPKRLQDIAQRRGEPTNRDENEIAGYRDVLDTIHTNYENILITPNYILQLHRDLYNFAPNGIGGEWKRTDNEIAEVLPDGTRRVRFHPTQAWQTPDAMRDLCDAYRQLTEQGEIDSLLLIPAFVLDFLCIHPVCRWQRTYEPTFDFVIALPIWLRSW